MGGSPGGVVVGKVAVGRGRRRHRPSIPLLMIHPASAAHPRCCLSPREDAAWGVSSTTREEMFSFRAEVWREGGCGPVLDLGRGLNERPFFLGGCIDPRPGVPRGLDRIPGREGGNWTRPGREVSETTQISIWKNSSLCTSVVVKRLSHANLDFKCYKAI
jgi:hypothetical protein